MAKHKTTGKQLPPREFLRPMVQFIIPAKPLRDSTDDIMLEFSEAFGGCLRACFDAEEAAETHRRGPHMEPRRVTTISQHPVR